MKSANQLPNLRLFVLLAILFTNFFLTSSRPLSNNQNTLEVGKLCRPIDTTILNDGPIGPTIFSPGSESTDADWPIISKEENRRKSGNGQDELIVIVVRREPNSGSNLKSATVNYPSCTLQYSESITISDTREGITQSIKNYYRLYTFVYDSSGDSTTSYHTYKTSLWWTRTSSIYTLGTPSVKWAFHGIDCSNNGHTYSKSGATFTPKWSGNTSYTYIWTFMDSSWVTLTPLGGSMLTTATTPRYKNGTRATPDLSTVIQYN